MRVDLVICDFGYLMVELYSEQGKKNPAIVIVRPTILLQYRE